MSDEDLDAAFERQRAPSHALDPDLLRRTVEAIRPSLQPVHPLPSTVALAGGMVLICTAVALAGAALTGSNGFERLDALGRFLIFPALLILMWAAARTLVAEMIPGSLRRLAPATRLVVTVAALLAAFALVFRDYRVTDFLAAGTACLATGVAYAVPAGVLSGFALHRGFALNPILAGLAAGVLGGLAGVTLLELHCPNFQAPHVLIWHTAVVPVSAVVGAGVGWVLRARSHGSARLS